LIIGLIFGLMDGLIEGPKLGLIFGVISGLIILFGVGLGCWSESPLKNGVISGSVGLLILAMIGWLMYGLREGARQGLIFGLIGGLGVGSLNRITLVETVSWNWNQFLNRMIPGSIVGLIVGLIFGLIIKLSEGPIGGLIVWLSEGLILRLSEGLIGGLIGGLTGGLISGLMGGFIDTVKAGKAFPNQGISLSRKHSLAAFLVTWLIVWLIFGLIGWMSEKLIGGLMVGLIGGLIGGLVFGLNRGGSAVIKHYALRLTLWLKGYTSFHFVTFLSESAKLILLKRVGGGYIFIHRMLLEYFADLPEATSDRAGEAQCVRESD
jgi:hypothetical protein